MSVFIERLVFKALISFIVTAISKAKDHIDWKTIKIAADKHVRDLIPGSWFDDLAIAFVDKIIDACQEALGHGKEIKILLDLIAQGNVQGAIEMLKDAVIAKIGHQVPFEEKPSIKEMLA